MTIQEQYEADGYVFPLRALSRTQALNYRHKIELLEKQHGQERLPSRGYGNIAIDFLDEITRLDSILDPVSEVLGPDLLVWGANLFVKEAHSPSYISWHQDLTYWGLDNTQEVTAWVALTASNVSNGCMKFVKGSHRREIVEHRDTFHEDNLLSRGQAIAVDIDDSQAVDVELLPGEFSLHHGRMFHASSANRSNDRRIGFAIRYISPAMAQTDGKPTIARLVRGRDQHGHFELAPAPSGVLLGDDVERMLRAEALQSRYAYKDAREIGKRERT